MGVRVTSLQGAAVVGALGRGAARLVSGAALLLMARTGDREGSRVLGPSSGIEVGTPRAAIVIVGSGSGSPVSRSRSCHVSCTPASFRACTFTVRTDKVGSSRAPPSS